MELTVNLNLEKRLITLQGRLNLTTAPVLQATLDKLDKSVRNITLDFSDVEYIASAGLRVLVGGRKMMVQRGGDMIIKSPTPEVLEVMQMTGLTAIFTIEE